ncbi:MAG TPA: ethanolamine ammonia-lyase subunit EutB, partial [Flavitalea sp.]|nr:ethanolamine ammonia-lyase subunit EutB [Flavitalea sp.]
MSYQHTIGQKVYRFNDLKDLLAKASPLRSGDILAGIAAETYEERVAAQMTLADVPVRNFLNEVVVPYDEDEITRLIIDSHDAGSFEVISHLTIGELRDWLLLDEVDTMMLSSLKWAITPEMAAAVSKLMRNQDLIAVARKAEVVTKFRNTIGLKGHFSTRLQPNHPTDDPRGIAASIIDGLLYASGDAVIGINPAMDNPAGVMRLLVLMDNLRQQFEIPMQSCVLTHITTTIGLVNQGA